MGNSSIGKLPVPIEPSFIARKNETQDKANSLKNVTLRQMTPNSTNEKAKTKEIVNLAKNGIFLNKTVNNTDSFKYVFSNSDLCYPNTSDNEGVFMLVMIMTAPGETERRNLIRATWANVTHVLGRRVVTIFLLGKSTDETKEEFVTKENEVFRDICKKDFLDTYRNLTLKTMMGLRWVDSFCNKTKFVLKIDSDTVPNLQNLVQHAETLLNDTILEGFLYKGAFPVRKVRKNSTWTKWFVSWELYPHPTYPPYVNGPSYLLSGHLVNSAVSVSKHIRYLPIEDVYVGMLMKTIGVAPKHERRYTQRRLKDTKEVHCFFSKAFTVFVESNKQLQTFWLSWNSFDRHQCS